MQKPKGSASTWIIVAVTLLAIGATVVLFFMNDEGSDTTNTQSQQEQQAETEEVSDTSLLESALAGNTSIECNYTHEDGSNGVAYLQKDRTFRVEQTTEEGEFRMIMRGDTAYIWTVGQNEGFKMDNSAWEEEYEDNFAVFSPDQFEQEAEGVNDIDCERRSNFDSSLFTPPENVQFTDFSAQLEELQNFNQ